MAGPGAKNTYSAGREKIFERKKFSIPRIYFFHIVFYHLFFHDREDPQFYLYPLYHLPSTGIGHHHHP